MVTGHIPYDVNSSHQAGHNLALSTEVELNVVVAFSNRFYFSSLQVVNKTMGAVSKLFSNK